MRNFKFIALLLVEIFLQGDEIWEKRAWRDPKKAHSILGKYWALPFVKGLGTWKAKSTNKIFN